VTDVICGNMTIASITPVLLGKIGQDDGESVPSKLAGKRGLSMDREIKFRAILKGESTFRDIAGINFNDLKSGIYIWFLRVASVESFSTVHGPRRQERQGDI